MSGGCKSAWIVGLDWIRDRDVRSNVVYFAQTGEEARDAGEIDHPEHAVMSMERAPWLDGVAHGRDARSVIAAKVA